MSNRAKRKQGRFSPLYWQNAADTSVIYNALMNQVLNIALARFQWINLPPTCDERYLELTLLTNGVATLATPKAGKEFGMLYSLQAVTDGSINMYGNPSTWRALGDDGKTFDVDGTNGALIWDSLTRAPIYPLLQFYVRELTDLVKTKQLNRQHQKMPYVFTGDQSQQLDMINLYKQIAGGEPAIIGTDMLTKLEPKAINTGVQFLGNALNDDYLNVWQNIFTALGVNNMPFKSERQVENEVDTYEEPSEINALSPLTARRQGARQLMRLNIAKLDHDKPITCIWRQDWLKKAIDNTLGGEDA